MSHITHLYHLAALDFINTNAFPGMSPWIPSYTADSLIATGLTGSVANELVANYVEALSIRRKMHTASTLFSGRHPIQNAIVPGGVTTLFSSTYPLFPQTGTDYDMFGPFNAADTETKFKSLLMDVRTFINQKYIPNVITVAGAYSSFWTQGVGCMRLLSYGDYPTNSSGTLAIKRGVVDVPNIGLSLLAFDQANIAEYVDYSWYNYGVLDPAGLHPFDGRTTPNMGTTNGYSWLKAPRLLSATDLPLVCEVGPLARMVTTYLSTNQVNANDSDTPAGGVRVGGAYDVTALVDIALAAVGHPGNPAILLSALGRHAARACEAKYLADLMAGPGGWVDQLVPDAPCYTYKRIPKQISKGAGLCEAPRGALGHWIKIEGRKVAKYQCVVPSTWNFSPAHAATTPGSIANRGAVEAALVGSNINIGTGGTVTERQIVNILRLVHPFDCCIACAVHVVSPDGKEKLKFAIGPDGRPTNVEIAE